MCEKKSLVATAPATHTHPQVCRSSLWQFSRAFGYMGLLQRVLNDTGSVAAWGVAATAREGNATIVPAVEGNPSLPSPNVWLVLDVAPRNSNTTSVLGHDMTSRSIVQLYGFAGPGECGGTA